MGDPVSVASGIAGLVTLAIQVTDTVYKYTSAVRDKSTDIKELHEELLLLGEVLCKLRDFIDDQKRKGNAFGGDAVLSKAISDCKVRIERIGDKLLPSGASKIWRAIDRLKWPFDRDEILQLMENLRRFRALFTFSAQVQGFQILSKTSEDATKALEQLLNLSRKTEEMYAQSGHVMEAAVEQSKKLQQVIDVLPLLANNANQLREISDASKLAETREQERRMTEILDWLAPLESFHKHRDVQARRAKGTGQWLLRSPEFCSWVAKDSPGDLMAIGGPGVGKSVLASLVVDELRQKYKDADTAVVFYYFDYAEQQLQSSVHLARCILRQLCSTGHVIPSAVSEFYQKSKNEIKDQQWFQELQSILRRVMSTFANCYLVIDALDETEAVKQRPALFALLEGIRSVQMNIKLFVTARPHVANLDNKFLQPTRIDVSANEADLRRFLTDLINSHPDADDIMDDDLKGDILDQLCKNANGMFLLPALHVRNILEQPTRGDVRATLKFLSADLTMVFASTLERIRRLPERRQAVAFKTLLWISHAKRPLLMEELQAALAVRFEEQDINKDHFLSPRTILDCCCGLVEFEPESHIVHLVHYTLEEFLRTHDHDLFENPNIVILRTCLKYLSFASLKTLPFKNRPGFDRALAQSPFLSYASREWGHHAVGVEVPAYADLALPLLESSQSLLLMSRVRDASSTDMRKYRERMWTWALSDGGGGAISLAASFGLTSLLRVLLSRWKEPNLFARNQYGSTALHEAAIYGHEDTAEALIAHGADVLDQNKGRATPFYLATSYGRLSMAKKLLKYSRAQLDVHCKGGQQALHKATDLGSGPLVEFLLQNGALVAAKDEKDQTPLHIAALKGYLDIVKMLVLGGAPVHIENKYGLTPLDNVATTGSAPVIEFLIRNGASVRHRGHDHWTSISRAARGGHVDAVVILLENGADLLEQDHRGDIPLYHAVRSGSLEAVTQLLEYDPTLKARQIFHGNRKRITARQTAYFTAHYDVHKYIRTQEWDVLGTKPTSSEMTSAIEAGDLAKVTSLLSSDGDNMEDPNLDIPDEDGMPPLHVSIQENQLAIAMLLISRGANIELPAYHGWRPLHIAASIGSLELVNLLLDRGADISVRTSTFQTSLHKAASSKSLDVVRRLVGAGAEIDARNDAEMTPNMIAAHQNDLAMCRYFVLECGADVLIRDRSGRTAAAWAERSAHLEILGFLKSQMKMAKDRTGDNALLRNRSARNSSTWSLEDGEMSEGEEIRFAESQSRRESWTADNPR